MVYLFIKQYKHDLENAALCASASHSTFVFELPKLPISNQLL